MIWLQDEYLHRLPLSQFKRVSRNIYNFRCPYCGDSQKSQIKARGYIFVPPGSDSYVYKCHNCGISRSFDGFLQDQDPEGYKEYVFAKLTDRKHNIDLRTPTKKLYDQVRSEDILSYLKKAYTHNDAFAYLRARQIPEKHFDDIYVTDNINELTQFFPKYEDKTFTIEPRIVLPSRARTGAITGIISRSIYDYSVLKHINFRHESDAPLTYNLDKVNLSKRVIVVEGAFDSMFLNNCMSASGSSLTKVEKHLIKANTVLVFDNEPRNKEIVKTMHRAISGGWSLCIWDNRFNGKDVNEMVLTGFPASQIEDYILTHTYNGIRLQLEFENWKRV